MTRDDIIRMAREAGMVLGRFDVWDAELPDLDRFAALVAAAEREACAKVCDEMVLYTGFDCAAAIRARGEK
jgi:hypothetical protein